MITTELKTILKYLNSKNAPGIDKIPIKLVKLASGLLADPLPLAMNNSISTPTFSNNVKITTVLKLMNLDISEWGKPTLSKN